jgi:epoxyqueuosine reductase
MGGVSAAWERSIPDTQSETMFGGQLLSIQPAAGGKREQFKRELLKEARRLGFLLAGIAAATPAETRTAYLEWLESGMAGEMHYLARDPQRRIDPKLAWPPTASIVVVALPYRTGEPEGRNDPRRGQVARYAAGDDYHDVLAARLKSLLSWAEQRDPELTGRWYVDTGPLLERDIAARAGLGWFGKNTCLLHREHGSYFFLGALLLNVELPADAATSAHCGTCARCLEACPTGAFLEPYVMDARRCISYLTIELRGPIPREYRPLVGNWIFGCDICQEVCPWNRKAPHSTEAAFRPRVGLSSPELVPLLAMTQEEFSRRFRGSPIKRARRRGFLRNVCVALGNSADAGSVPALLRALEHDEPLVRGHAAWALGRLGGAQPEPGLRDRLSAENDAWVREEIQLALRDLENFDFHPPGPHWLAAPTADRKAR